jgi:hypothetical protein
MLRSMTYAAQASSATCPSTEKAMSAGTMQGRAHRRRIAHSARARVAVNASDARLAPLGEGTRVASLRGSSHLNGCVMGMSMRSAPQRTHSATVALAQDLTSATLHVFGLLFRKLATQLNHGT